MTFQVGRYRMLLACSCGATLERDYYPDTAGDRIAEAFWAVHGEHGASGSAPHAPPDGPEYAEGDQRPAWCPQHQELGWLYEDGSTACMYNYVVERKQDCEVVPIRLTWASPGPGAERESGNRDSVGGSRPTAGSALPDSPSGGCPVRWPAAPGETGHECRCDPGHSGEHVCECDETFPGDGEHYEAHAAVDPCPECGEQARATSCEACGWSVLQDSQEQH